MKTVKLNREERNNTLKRAKEFSEKRVKAAKAQIKETSKSLFKVKKDLDLYYNECEDFRAIFNRFLQEKDRTIFSYNINDITCLLKGYRPIDEENGIFKPAVLDKDGNERTAFTVTEFVNAISKEYKKIVKASMLNSALQDKLNNQ